MAEDTATTGLRRWLATAGEGGRRMTHAELAVRLGYSFGYVYRIFGGKPITPSFRGRFQEAFGARAAEAAFESASAETGPEWPVLDAAGEVVAA